MNTYSVPGTVLCILTHLSLITTSEAILRKTNRNLTSIRVTLREIQEQIRKMQSCPTVGVKQPGRIFSVSGKSGKGLQEEKHEAKGK